VNHATEGDLDTILFNPASSAAPKWRTFKLLRWMQNLHQSTWGHEILYANKSSKAEQLLKDCFCENPKYEREGWLKAKIEIWFYGDNS
jgi:hypothetical protein